MSHAIAWLLILLLPVMNVVPKGVTMAERYLILPSLSLAMLGGLAALRLHARSEGRAALRNALIGAAVALCVLLGAASLRRSLVWRESVVLWETTLAHPWHDPTAFNQLGLAWLTLRGDASKAISVLRAGLAELDERGTPVCPLAAEMRYHLVLSHLSAGDTAEARGEWPRLRSLCETLGEAGEPRFAREWEPNLRRAAPAFFDD